MFRQLLGWRKITATEYSAVHSALGGSVITAPMVIDFIARHSGVDATYWGRPDKHGALIAAVPAWGRWIAGDKEALEHFGIARQFDFGTPEVLIPLAPEFSGLLPFRTKHLSPLIADQIGNCTARNRGRSLCFAKGLAKDGMSARSCQKRRNEVRRFVDAGGRIEKIDQFSPDQLAEIYIDLFQKRWQTEYKNVNQTTRMFVELAPMLRGHVLLLADQAVAFQLLLGIATHRCYSLEFINAGVDTRHEELSPGSVLTWLNIEQAWQSALAADVPMRYSFGRNSGAYKALWANEQSLHRVVSL